jgi:hypothetical protein
MKHVYPLRTLLRTRWLNSINQLTSLELQQKSWLDINKDSPRWSFVEFCCMYLDDLSFNDTYSNWIEEGIITKKEYKTIKNWHEALLKYEAPQGDHYNHSAILNDPLWQQIVQLGFTSKKRLAVLLIKEERVILIDKIHYS